MLRIGSSTWVSPTPERGAGRFGAHAALQRRRTGARWAFRAAPRQNRWMSTDSTTAAHPDTFGARTDLVVGGRTYEIFDIKAPSLAERHEIERLPYSIKVILENLLRHEDGPHVSADDIEAVAGWGANPEGHGQGAGDAAHEIALTPERVLMQDFTGVPGVVDLAAMRDALARLGGERRPGQPARPGRTGHRPLGHRGGDRATHRPTTRTSTSSTSATSSATSCCAGPSGRSTASGSYRRAWASATRSTSSTCRGWSSPPRTGVPSATRLVGTDSHTTMVNGLGVLGWGVGGIEAEAAMLGQPLSMLLPPGRGAPDLAASRRRGSPRPTWC